MGFHATDTLVRRPQTLPGRSRLSSNRRQVQVATPTKNRVWDFFATFSTSVWKFVTQPVEPHRETFATSTIIVSDVRLYGFRYLSPTLGRFVNRDPAEEQGGINQFAFVMNSPVMYVDMLGLSMTANADGTYQDDASRSCCKSAMKQVQIIHILIGTRGHLVGHVFLGLPDPVNVPGSTNMTQYIGWYPRPSNFTDVIGDGEWRDNTPEHAVTRTTTETFDVCPQTLARIQQNITDAASDWGYDLFAITNPNCRRASERVLEDAGLHPTRGGYEPGALGPRQNGTFLWISW